MAIYFYKVGIVRDTADGKLSLIVNRRNPRNPNEWWLAAIDQNFIRDFIWPEILRLHPTERRLPLSPPPIYLLGRWHYPALGRYTGTSIEIYEAQIYDAVRKEIRSPSEDKDLILRKECVATLYTVIAHELLHHFYSYADISIYDQHQKMCQEGKMHELARLINQKLGTRGINLILDDKLCPN